jgi:hypothetical protein
MRSMRLLGSARHPVREWSWAERGVHLLEPPDYTALRPVGEGQGPEGTVVCLDLRQRDPNALASLNEIVPALRQLCRYCPLVLLAGSQPKDLLRIFHSRPLLRGFRAILSNGVVWRDVLREALSTEVHLHRDVATWLLYERKHRRSDEQLVEEILSVGRTDQLGTAVFGVLGSSGTIAARLSRLELPPPSKVRTLGMALTSAMRVQRSRQTVDEIAFDLGYASGAGVSLLISRTFRAAVRDVRTRLGWEWLLARWERTSRAWPRRPKQRLRRGQRRDPASGD